MEYPWTLVPLTGPLKTPTPHTLAWLRSRESLQSGEIALPGTGWKSTRRSSDFSEVGKLVATRLPPDHTPFGSLRTHLLLGDSSRVRPDRLTFKKGKPSASNARREDPPSRPSSRSSAHIGTYDCRNPLTKASPNRREPPPFALTQNAG